MIRKLAALLPVAAALIAAADATATTLDTSGTGHDDSDWNAPKIAPSTHCQSLMLYLADVPEDPNGMRRYRFTGTCTINTAPARKLAKMKTVEVLVDAEYFPRMKRASERVLVQDPDLGVSLSTWATCPSDPFSGTGVVCTDKGMGANKFDKFINKDDAPFARQRATTAQVAAAKKKFADAKQRGATAASFYVNPTLDGISPIRKSTSGQAAQVIVNVKGGAGMCPTELDFGDGTKSKIILWSPNVGPYQHQVDHVFSKPGFYKVQARTLPGCSGGHLAYALVK